MTGASIEATLELWASSLREVKARMRPLFSQERVATSARRFLDGLLGAERRKTHPVVAVYKAQHLVVRLHGSYEAFVNCNLTAEERYNFR